MMWKFGTKSKSIFRFRCTMFDMKKSKCLILGWINYLSVVNLSRERKVSGFKWEIPSHDRIDRQTNTGVVQFHIFLPPETSSENPKIPFSLWWRQEGLLLFGVNVGLPFFIYRITHQNLTPFLVQVSLPEMILCAHSPKRPGYPWHTC